MEEEYIYIGKIVNTHGIKGEIRILSDFEYKERVFYPGMKIYIGRKKEAEEITSYRHHKNFEMITMKNYQDINEVLKYKGLYVYIKKEDLFLEKEEYLTQDLIGLTVIVDQKKQGQVVGIRESGKNHRIMEIEKDHKLILIPYQKEFITKIDLQNKTLLLNPIKGMFE